MTTVFSVLYCSQLYRQKKVKNWQDGTVTFEAESRKLSLFDNLDNKLETLYKWRRVVPGDEIDFDRYFCMVEAPLCPGNGKELENEEHSKATVPLVSPIRSSSVSQRGLNIARPYKPPRQKLENGGRSLMNVPKQGGSGIQASHQAESLGGGARIKAGSRGTAPVKKVLRSPTDLITMFLATPPPACLAGLMKVNPVHRSNEVCTGRLPDGLVNLRQAQNDDSTQFLCHENSVVEEQERAKRRRLLMEPNTVDRGHQESTAYSRLGEPGEASLPSSDIPKDKEGHDAVHPAFDSLRFPTSKVRSRLSLKKLKRSALIPTRFASPKLYREHFIRAVSEHLQVELSTIAVKFHLAMNERATFGDTEDYLRSKGVAFYANCSFIWSRKTSHMHQPSQHLGDSIFLKVNKREHHTAYSKDVIWIISDSCDFNEAFLARSLFFGVSKSDTVELCPLDAYDVRKTRDILGASGTAKPVWAIRGAQASGELQMIDALREHLEKTPLLPWLLDVGSAQKKCPSSRSLKSAASTPLIKQDCLDIYQDTLEALSKEFGLNSDQTRVLQSFADSISTPDHQPITLVHGVFGSGKSFLISVLIIFLHRILELDLIVSKDTFKVTIASMTNVAVDRILLGLLNLGFTEFVRVGSLKKIAKLLLPFTAQSKQEDDAKELRELLDESLTESDRRAVRATIAKFKQNENQALLAKSFVVGVTCSATNFEIFDDFKSTILILDECSQMTEPLSLLPLARFCTRKALLVGDPLQLPPTISSNCGHKEGLDRTLFERLAAAGLKPILLRTQYRCHPIIGSVADSLFYRGQLIHGTSADDCKTLVSGLPTLCFVDVENGCEIRQRGGSFVNAEEADFVVKLTYLLAEKGVEASDIGVICLYKDQSEMIASKLRDGVLKNLAQTSTVDAFQGAEKSIIILSTVRTKSAGFIDEPRRINVALTRARRHMIIVGQRRLLCSNRLWSSVLNDHCASMYHDVAGESLEMNIIL
ncbi:hypothetical protein, variant [Spizellomyces punctatus DAOM BR117]|uniref:DUF2439 domain-containing protein n=1 Tax=Spizellomyces punctatus (strain DAOM BR117) TaxID=645134 RepID=A0A0L0HKT5_SPIPD|nr:hypothetical protein, variant [Spizellomyces punctatus DAOM BR117]KND01510.1 hypothetical protein, variant [Spizellomyces punctatus DAOM BR117]|eukprot:XP_016609549.1 hypothetical protein, variant [Spizellomyces punctatus DAOM BR117]